jgi:hypothetical protein
VHQCCGLLCNCGSNDRIAVPKRGNRDAAEKIEIALAIDIPQLRSNIT